RSFWDGVTTRPNRSGRRRSDILRRPSPPPRPVNRAGGTTPRRHCQNGECTLAHASCVNPIRNNRLPPGLPSYNYDYRASFCAPAWLRANFERTKTRAARLSRARVICCGSHVLASALDRGGLPACASWLQAAPDLLAPTHAENSFAAAPAFSCSTILPPARKKTSRKSATRL